MIFVNLIILNTNPYLFINKNYRKDGSKRLDINSGPIASVRLDATIQTNSLGEESSLPGNKNFFLYPVITISTNTDRERLLAHEGFGIMRFDIDSIKCNVSYKKTMIGGNDTYRKYMKYKHKYLVIAI